MVNGIDELTFNSFSMNWFLFSIKIAKFNAGEYCGVDELENPHKYRDLFNKQGKFILQPYTVIRFKAGENKGLRKLVRFLQ